MKAARFRTHPAHWPWPARSLACLMTTLLCAGSGLLLAAGELDDARQALRQQHHDLRTQYQWALNQLAQLPTLRAQQDALEVQLSALQAQRWPAEQRQPERLHTKLARRATECGLTLESFQPQPGRLAASFRLRGQYADLLRFIALVSHPPMPVLFESLDISASERDGRVALLMNATASAPGENKP